jgi:MoaA/NifB/PqqE/SkfB family radical SAM enzyme
MLKDLIYGMGKKLPMVKKLIAERDELRDRLENQIAVKNSEIKKLSEENKSYISSLNNLSEGISFLNYRNAQLIKLHDDVVERKWKNDVSRRKLVCLKPFTTIEILPRGEVYTCCSAEVKHNHFIGNVYTESFSDIWNSDKAKILRYSVSCGDFEYCNSLCRWLQESNLKTLGNTIVQRNPQKYYYPSWEDCVVDSLPEEIFLSCDESCNLYCTSCRSAVKVNGTGENERLFQMLMNVVRPVLRGCHMLSSLGSGDFFASQVMQKFYKTLTKEEFPYLNLSIETNCQLLTPDKWNELSNLDGMVKSIKISIDAAEKSTYENLRRDGDWFKLCKNLEFVSSLYSNNKIEEISFRFIIQKENYQQMPAFVDFARQFGVKSIFFQRLANWGTYSDEHYLDIDVLNHSNSRYEEAKELFLSIKNNEKDISIIDNIVFE